jgi:cytochrome oxidase Cu insertion factor (SCO1/SenC/PrrC family)
MSIDALKQALAGLDDAGRHQIMAYLISIDDQKDAEYLAKLARKIDDKNPANWITLEELEKRLSLGKYDNGE